MYPCHQCGVQPVEIPADICDSCFDLLTNELISDGEDRDQFTVWPSDSVELVSECDESCSICFPHSAGAG